MSKLGSSIHSELCCFAFFQVTYLKQVTCLKQVQSLREREAVKYMHCKRKYKKGQICTLSSR